MRDNWLIRYLQSEESHREKEGRKRRINYCWVVAITTRDIATTVSFVFFLEYLHHCHYCQHCQIIIWPLFAKLNAREMQRTSQQQVVGIVWTMTLDIYCHQCLSDERSTKTVLTGGKFLVTASQPASSRYKQLNNDNNNMLFITNVARLFICSLVILIIDYIVSQLFRRNVISIHTRHVMWHICKFRFISCWIWLSCVCVCVFGIEKTLWKMTICLVWSGKVCFWLWKSLLIELVSDDENKWWGTLLIIIEASWLNIRHCVC